MSSSLIALLFFAVSMSVSPGPNNLMVATSAANFGLRRTIPHMLGIIFGFPLLLLLVGMGLGGALAAAPMAQRILQYVGAAYMLFLAYKIATTKAGGDVDAPARSKPLTFLQATAFQWVNPKAWIIAVGAVTTYATIAPSLLSSTILIVATFALISVPTNLFWATLGLAAARLLRSARAFRIFNIAMAALLAGSIVLLFV